MLFSTVPEPKPRVPAQVETNPSPTSSQTSGNAQAITVTSQWSESNTAEQPVTLENSEPVSPQLFPYEQLARVTEPQELLLSADYYYEDLLNNDFQLYSWDFGGDDKGGFSNQTLF